MSSRCLCARSASQRMEVHACLNSKVSTAHYIPTQVVHKDKQCGDQLVVMCLNSVSGTQLSKVAKTSWNCISDRLDLSSVWVQLQLKHL